MGADTEGFAHWIAAEQRPRFGQINRYTAPLPLAGPPLTNFHCQISVAQIPSRMKAAFDEAKIFVVITNKSSV
jgi:hypothetical protein